jgi:SAM-dependent methyltransferase
MGNAGAHLRRRLGVTENFSPDWLALREPFDAAARSVALAARFAAALPAEPRILDLAAGTGSMFRWLGPIIGRNQHWILADADASLLVLGRGPAVETLVVDLANALDRLPFESVDGVVCSALLDLVSEQWLYRLVAALRTPFLACLSVDGRDDFAPPHPLDVTVLHAFRRDQARDKGFGPALGPCAPAVLQQALTARGFSVRSERSDWLIPRTAKAMLRAIVHGHARVTAMQDWQRKRLAQINGEELAIRIGHRDILALPR